MKVPGSTGAPAAAGTRPSEVVIGLNLSNRKSYVSSALNASFLGGRWGRGHVGIPWVQSTGVLTRVRMLCSVVLCRPRRRRRQKKQHQPRAMVRLRGAASEPASGGEPRRLLPPGPQRAGTHITDWGFLSSSWPSPPPPLVLEVRVLETVACCIGV